MILLPVPDKFTVMLPCDINGECMFLEAGPSYFALNENSVAQGEGVAQVLSIDLLVAFAVEKNAHLLKTMYCKDCGQRMNPDAVAVDGKPDGGMFPEVFRTTYRCTCGKTYSDKDGWL